MNMKSKEKNTKIELVRQIAISIVSEINKLQTIAEEIAQSDCSTITRNGEAQLVLDSKDNAKKPRKHSPNNPLPRAQRLRPTYLGNPADFERTAATITPELKRSIKQVVTLPLSHVVKLYRNGLQLRRHNHSTYKFCATMHAKVVGSPARRFFRNLREAVTWLELIRVRRQAGILRHNIPRGGVRRDQFQMPWEKKKELATTPPAELEPKQPQVKGWPTERHAKHAAAAKSKRAYRSVNPFLKGGAVRPKATTEQILGAPAMPGNNLTTASLTGSTAATFRSQVPAPQNQDSGEK
jgi:hypothetical protein